MNPELLRHLFYTSLFAATFLCVLDCYMLYSAKMEKEEKRINQTKVFAGG